MYLNLYINTVLLPNVYACICGHILLKQIISLILIMSSLYRYFFIIEYYEQYL